MRITVGGVLLFAGIGTAVVLGPMKNMVDLSFLTDQVGPLKDSIGWVQNYFKGSQPVETAPINVPSESQSSSSESAKAVEAQQQPAAAAPVAATAPAPVAAPVEPPPIAVAPVVKPKSVKTRRHRRAKKKVAATTAAAKSATSAAAAPAENKSAGDLTGTYVALQLKTGREVKGILKGKANGKYTLEIPGMGPFDYDANNVVGVKAVE